MNAKTLILVLVLVAVSVAGCGAPKAGPEQDATAVVEGFYAEYLGYIGQGRASGEFRNPMVNRAYREMPGLAPAFVEELDALVEKGLMADPILCAQDVPEFVEVASVKEEGSRAVVTLSDSFPSHMLTVDLDRSGAEWLITGIRCGQ